MNLTVEFVSQNLVTQVNFVELRNNWNFTFFETTSVGCRVTHDKPCVTGHAKANACVTHGKSCVHMHANGEVYKKGGKSFRKGGEEQKGKEGIKKERRKKIEREKKGRVKEGEKEISVPIVGTRRTKK